jgi:hypothetical protein
VGHGVLGSGIDWESRLRRRHADDPHRIANASEAPEAREG